MLISTVLFYGIRKFKIGRSRRARTANIHEIHVQEAEMGSSLPEVAPWELNEAAKAAARVDVGGLRTAV